MFTFMQKAVGYISGSVGDSELCPSKYERPKLEDFISVSCFESKEFVGKITTISERDIVVDNDIYFSIPMSESKCKFKVGDVVQGTAERQSQYEAWRAVNMLPCPKVERWEGENSKLTGETIPSRDLDAGIPGILKNDLFPTSGYKQTQPDKLLLQPAEPCRAKIETQKTLVGRVKYVHGDTVTLNEDAYFSLSSVKSAFNVLEGDWIVCKLSDDHPSDLQQEDDLRGFLKVTQVEPLRKKKIKGEVTRVYTKHIIINNEVFCSKDLDKDIPGLRLGDAVITEVIESDQNHFGWRSISLSPDVFPEMKVLKLGIASRLNGFHGHATAELFKDKHNIVISNSVRFPKVYLGCKSYITLFIKNVGVQARSLLRILFINSLQDSQFSVVSESLDETHTFTPITILPHKSSSVKIACTGKFLGQCKQVCIFDFGSFKIGRHLTATVEDKQMDCIGPTSPYYPLEKKKLNCPNPSDSRVVRGEKPFNAPAFIPMSLPQYHIPTELWTAIANEEKACDVAPVLKEATNPENYQDRFSVLLYLEEIEMILQLRRFDIARTTFSPHGEFLSLTVPGLAEKRPSLMIGDSVIASNPAGIGGPEYEGFIHDVLHTKVLLKFHPIFHEQCQDKDYSVRFNFNRTPLRRSHYALKFCLDQHGSEVLFPKKLKFRLPQVVYVDSELLPHNITKKMGPTATAGQVSYQKSMCSYNDMKSGSEDSLVHLNAYEGSSAGVKEELVEEVENRKIICNVTDVTSRCALEVAGAEKTEKFVENGNPLLCNVIDVTDSWHTSVRTASNCNTDAKGSTVMNGKIVEVAKHDVGTKNGTTDYLQAEKSFHGVVNDKSKIESSPCSVKGSGKRGTSATPPRIPVVTRLFGVPSSGSSANSSICCSDDESKTNTDLESDPKFRKKLQNRSEIDNIENEIYKSKPKNILSENSSSSVLKMSGTPFSSVEKNGRIDQGSRANYLEDEKTEFQLADCVQALQNKTSGANECCANSVSKTLQHKAQDNSENGKVTKNGCSRQSITGSNEHFGLNCDSKGGKKSSTVISFEELLKESSAKKYNYCVPVLPEKPSVSDKIQNGKVPVLEWFNKKLNGEQKMAVRRILEGSTRPLPYIIYGPPGTGKTITVVESVLQIFTLVNHSRLLIVAPSNSAADLVTERLLEFGVMEKADLVRLNAFQRKEEAIPEHIHPYCYNGDQLMTRVRQRVIITTATTAGVMYRLGLHNGHFTHVFVDEAGQLTEPECLVALGLVNSVSGQIVLAGDPQQLGPVILSRLAKTYGLQESLLHRLCNSVLYQIRDKLLNWSELPNPSCPVLFHAVVSENHQEGDSPSWFNPTETFQVVRYAKSLTNFGLMPSNIGIITPYRKQVEKIRQLLTIFGVQPGIKVGTVEEFQGQERTAIIISTVRSSEELLAVDREHSLGFVKCRRRFNVAITRAQSLLIVVGNPVLLSLDNCWLSFISFCISKKAYIGAEIDLDNFNLNEFDLVMME
ncbi:uncharacterized protein LOC135206091 isoform X2 [Macrobrachium nipponense]|uniref:uncharacterized protein LOC135206091 isoform X2 n=1 Tax=Macrobrachium nipponense TaxID=159736 RepID=UPI0030C82496